VRIWLAGSDAPVGSGPQQASPAAARLGVVPFYALVGFALENGLKAALEHRAVDRSLNWFHSHDLLRRDVVLTRHFRDDRARRKRFRHDPRLDLIAPMTAPDPWLCSVGNMLDHLCEPFRARRNAYRSSARQQQGGAK
jgi:hypothetical protein